MALDAWNEGCPIVVVGIRNTVVLGRDAANRVDVMETKYFNDEIAVGDEKRTMLYK